MFIPDTLRFVFAVTVLVGVGVGVVYGLAHFPPEQSEVIRSLPHEKLRQG